MIAETTRERIPSPQWEIIAAVWLLLAMPSASVAQQDSATRDIDTPGLAIEATAGWDGTVDLSTPVPVSFRLTNDSDQIIEGRLLLSDPMQGYEADLGEVFVGPHSTRRLTSIQALDDWYECFATLRVGDQVFWRRELALMTGKEFLASVNYGLFVDAGGRRLSLPGAVSDTTAIAETDSIAVPEAGRPITMLTVKHWQVPIHPGPLMAAQALVFPEQANADGLNRAQWKAIAEWMCLGGSVFVHRESKEVLDRLTDSAPLGSEPAAQTERFQVRRVGLGAIYEFPQPLFSSDGAETREAISDTIAKLRKHHISTLVNSGEFRRHRGGRADLNRIIIIGFFGFYAFLTGVVAMLLFRMSPRRLGIYTVIVVIGASVLSGLLGGVVRLSKGDLRWITVTQPGAGGVVQAGRIEVQSAGGRNTQVAVSGNRPDLQHFGRMRSYYSWNEHRQYLTAFNWQPNLAHGEVDRYQVHVPITPWGQRHLRATAFSQDLPRIGFSLNLHAADVRGENEAEPSARAALPSATFSLKLVNRLPFDLTDGWLIIGARPLSTEPTNTRPANRRMRGQRRIPTPLPATGAQLPDDVYYMQSLPRLGAGAAYEETFRATFQAMPNYWDLARTWDSGSLTPHRVLRLGSESAWVIVRLEKSPILAIDEQGSDFVPHEGLHLFVQEILSDEMPDLSSILDDSPESSLEKGRP